MCGRAKHAFAVASPVISISELKAKGREAQLAVLLHNKRSLLDGMVFEAVLDQKFFRVSSVDLEAIPCQAMVAAIPSRKRPLVFVWFTAENRHRSALINLLSAHYDVHEVAFDADRQDFSVSSEPCGCPGELLSEFLARITGRPPSVTLRDIPDHDQLGQKAVTYGFLQFGSFESTILPRILKDFRIEPYCRQCWDLDRFFAYRGSIWSLEVKHKYPTRGGYFGLNKGQVGEIVTLTACGLGYLHLVFVKPHWNSVHSSMELLLDQKLAEHIGIIGCTIDHDYAVRLMKSPDKEAPAKTSLTGTRPQAYKKLGLDRFYTMGLYSEDAEKKIWPRILRLMSGQVPAGGPMTLARLESLRIEGRDPAVLMRGQLAAP